MERIRVRISGMSCEHCVKRVTRALESIPGVREVRVDLKSGIATFEKPEGVTWEDIARAIEEAGYRLE